MGENSASRDRTLDYGIYLGIEHATIALLEGMEVEVIKNNEEAEWTPSAVWIDKRDRVIVGRLAKEHLEEDPGNAFAEFKLQMGTNHEHRFARSGRVMRAEELSAEVLKSLKGDVRQRKGEELQAAVISVPAAFELPQCEATKRAAELAGISFSPLVQEPVAAAMAYGFQEEGEKAFWLVYDLGGGTFDAAVIQVREGVIQVVNHGGDNHLGGKLVDWAIVNELLVPAVMRQHRLPDFGRGNPRWRGAFAKLKAHAEDAKIRLSREETAEIVVPLRLDDQGGLVEFEYELTRAEVERVIEPVVLRTIDICKRVLEEKRVGSDDIEKLILVGGPTLTPYLRERIKDKKEGLGIALEFSIDPLTVVARGAAIFAGTQRVEGISRGPVVRGQYAIELEYKPVGPDVEVLVGGRLVASEGEEITGFTMEFVNKESIPPWRSGRLPLEAGGVFTTELWAEKGRQNVFLIELWDANGTKRETVPDRLTYTVGQVITDPPLIHSMGVALANNEVRWFLEKGTSLPARKREIFRTNVPVRRGENGCILRWPVVEGESQRADRNMLVGVLELNLCQVKRDVPPGSEVEVTIDIDASRLVRTKAYVPILDEEFEEVMSLEKKAAEPKKLKDDLQQQKARLTKVTEKASRTGDPKAKQLLKKAEERKMVREVETSLAASEDDPEAPHKAESRLGELKATIDQIEDAIEWQAMVAEAEDQIKRTQEIVRGCGDSRDKEAAATLEGETRQAIEARDSDILRRKIKDLAGLEFRILSKQPDFWVGFLENLEKRKAGMRDPALAEQLFGHGRRAILNNDLIGLQAAVRQLLALLPADQQRELTEGYGSTLL